MAPTSQLRVYTIDEGRLDDFVRGWLEGVRPLRLKHGFTIEGAWVIPEQSRFIWILTYDGPGSFEERDAAYYNSLERAAIDPDPADLIVTNETSFISRVAAN